MLFTAAGLVVGMLAGSWLTMLLALTQPNPWLFVVFFVVPVAGMGVSAGLGAGFALDLVLWFAGNYTLRRAGKAGLVALVAGVLMALTNWYWMRVITPTTEPSSDDLLATALLAWLLGGRK